MPSETTTPPYDAESDIAAWVVGSGMMLIQASAVIVGLLPCLLLLLPLALPLLVLPLLALPLALVARVARLVSSAVRSLRGSSGTRHVVPITPQPGRSN
jgi:hypothetical protein